MSPASAVAQVHYAQAWGNLNLFDFNDRLLSDKVSLHLWPMPQSNEELLYPIGIPGNDVSSSSSCSYIIFRVPACERSKKRFMSSCSCVRMHTGVNCSRLTDYCTCFRFEPEPRLAVPGDRVRELQSSGHLPRRRADRGLLPVDREAQPRFEPLPPLHHLHEQSHYREFPLP